MNGVSYLLPDCIGDGPSFDSDWYCISAELNLVLTIWVGPDLLRHKVLMIDSTDLGIWSNAGGNEFRLREETCSIQKVVPSLKSELMLLLVDEENCEL